MRLVLERGLVTAAEVHRYGIRGRDLSQSNGVVLVEVGNGRGFAVKDMRKPREGEQGSPENELQIYRAVRSHPELGLLLPRFRDHDEQQGLMILEGLLTSRRLDQIRTGTQVLGTQVAAWLGEALGTWHRHAATIEGLQNADPWLIHIDDDRRLAALEDDLRLRNLVDRILDDAELRNVPPLLRRMWRPTTVIHGDVRFANTMVRTSPPVVRFVDWETSGWGDPAWDAGAAVQEYLTSAIASGHDNPTSAGRAEVESFLAAYRAAADRPMPWSELAPFVSGRLLMRAIQLANWTTDSAEAIDRHLELAATLAVDNASPFETDPAFSP